ncbi:MAG TPA: hypothetical protein VHL11_10000 [Phototrophicaceae bacterium]|jgi:hypothetical protein|nr:hypothetical protein [Phototrophicaceae bacterium]
MQRIIVENRRKQRSTLEKMYPDAVLIDVTSKGEPLWVKFSPFYPHAGIPVPFSPGITAASVEGIWQGLKVFESQDIDVAKFSITSMQGIKRSTRGNGAIKGHRRGVNGTELLSYRDARYQIYLPAYQWILVHCLSDELAQLEAIAANRTLVLLDYETNADLDNLEKPLSHAALIQRYLQHHSLLMEP